MRAARLGFLDEGPFESLGGQFALRYGWPNDENVTQPDGFFSTHKSLVGVELKLGSTSSLSQIAKYAAMMLWEQEKTGKRDNLGLLFILPQHSQETHWSKLGLNDVHVAGESAPPCTIRRCTRDFIEKLGHAKLPPRVRELFDKESALTDEIERLRVAAVSWKWLRDEIVRVESELNCSARGDQTLKRLLVGLRAQIEAHGNTGIASAASAASPKTGFSVSTG